MAFAKAVKVDENTSIPKPKGIDAMNKMASELRGPQPEPEVTPEAAEILEQVASAKFEGPKQETMKAVRPVRDNVEVVCKENGFYRFGGNWVTLYRNKKISLPVEAAAYYKKLGKVDY